MFGLRTSTIFRNRWFAILWAVGICWIAVDFAGTPKDAEGNEVAAAIDATGSPIEPEDIAALRKFAETP